MYMYTLNIYTQNVFRIQCYYNFVLVTRGRKNYMGFICKIFFFSNTVLPMWRGVIS